MKVGDYVRTKEKGFQYPQIARIVKMEKDEGYKNQYYITLDHNLLPDYEYNIYAEDIDKSSQNIMDLIVKNDLVVDNYGNIYVVDYVFDNYIYTTTKQGNIIKTLCDYQIKTITTKEQFENTQYKVQK